MKTDGAHHSTQQDTKNGSRDLDWDFTYTNRGAGGNGSKLMENKALNGNDDRVEVTFGP